MSGRPVILIVEDHPLVRRLVADAVASLGYSTLTAESGDEAKQRLDQGLLPALVLSDVRMPGALDGLALGRWIRAHRPGLPIVLQTAFADAVTGEFPVLRKPFTIDELRIALEAWIGAMPHDPSESGSGTSSNRRRGNQSTN